MTEKEKMLAGKLYSAYKDGSLTEDRARRNRLLDELNSTKYGEVEKRNQIASKLFKHVGKNFHLEKPFHCDYGSNISVGDNFYANFDCIMLDVNQINIGNNCFMAPRVSLYTAGHPIDKQVRNSNLEYGYPINIGNDVWIGGSVTINPGVTIGDNVVIGSGSVVTKDIPSNVVACGNPCKVVRQITDLDHKKWVELAKQYYQE